jgi:hypothetical protein
VGKLLPELTIANCAVTIAKAKTEKITILIIQESIGKLIL